MRNEKKFLVTEVAKHLDKSDFVFLADYTKLNVPETKELRAQLAKSGAEFHVVKNSILRVAAKAKGLPEMDEVLVGQVAIVVGGKNPTGTAKALKEFGKSKEKLSFKAGVMALKKLTAAEFEFMASLPSLEVLRAQFLSLISTPASGFVRLLDAQAKKLGGAKA
jgi:large subunit ribosomal protein L10